MKRKLDFLPNFCFLKMIFCCSQGGIFVRSGFLKKNPPIVCNTFPYKLARNTFPYFRGFLRGPLAFRMNLSWFSSVFFEINPRSVCMPLMRLVAWFFFRPKVLRKESGIIFFNYDIHVIILIYLRNIINWNYDTWCNYTWCAATMVCYITIIICPIWQAKRDISPVLGAGFRPLFCCENEILCTRVNSEFLGDSFG